jgi:hypothetical protein
MMSPSMEMALRALANDRRLQILEWLKQPRKYFRPQVGEDFFCRPLQSYIPSCKGHADYGILF